MSTRVWMANVKVTCQKWGLCMNAGTSVYIVVSSKFHRLCGIDIILDPKDYVIIGHIHV